MRRLVVSAVLGVAVLATAACGGNPTRNDAAPSPGAVVTSAGTVPGATAPASAAPSGQAAAPSGAAARLPASDQAICSGRAEAYAAITTHDLRYLGLVDGRYQGGEPAKRDELAKLKQALGDYRDHLARRVGAAVDKQLAGAMRADIVYVNKRLTELKAAGTDYDGKVFRVADAINKGMARDQRVPGVCGR
ncbi:hypothetical protein [Catellatospora methionotrophica]|uniref:hypothetical protein n=1 Tax=Catellatospora methionotrophica TaxID=121620 RepID=UPI0019412D62|nr:hypothetical protein [Catellatospora methionotrophica]